MSEDALQVVSVIAGMGATMIITISRLFKPIQSLNKFFKCPMCIGFWVGVSIQTINYQPNIEFITKAFLFGCITSISSYTWYILMKPLINKYD